VRHLPDLTQLSHAQKDELILMLWPLQQQVQDLMAQMVAMQERIKQLEGRLALTTGLSSYRNAYFLSLCTQCVQSELANSFRPIQTPAGRSPR
jgi:hypothetical protein